MCACLKQARFSCALNRENAVPLLDPSPHPYTVRCVRYPGRRKGLRFSLQTRLDLLAQRDYEVVLRAFDQQLSGPQGALEGFSE